MSLLSSSYLQWPAQRQERAIPLRPLRQRPQFLEIILLMGLVAMPIARLFQFTLTATSIKKAPVTVLDIIVLLLTISYILRCFRESTIPFFRQRFPDLIILFTAWAIISLLYNSGYFGLDHSRLIFSGLYLARWFEYSVFYFVGLLVGRNWIFTKTAMTFLLMGQFLFAGFGIIQSIFLPNFAFILHPHAIAYIDYDVQGHRLVSTILDPNVAAAYITIGALLCLAMYLSGMKKYIYLFLIFLTALIMTLSRGGVLGFIVGAGILTIRPRLSRRKTFIIIAMAAALILAMLPWLLPIMIHRNRLTISDPSAQSRIHDWRLAERIIVANPVLGVGFNTFGFVMKRYTSQVVGNSSFGLAGDLLLFPVLTGIPGFCIYLAILWRVRQDCNFIIGLAQSRYLTGLANGIIAVLCAAVTSALFCNVLTYPEIAGTLFCLWGLAGGLADQGRRARSLAPHPSAARI